MKFAFEKWPWWNETYKSIVLCGTVDGHEFGLAFAGEAVAELFAVPYVPDRLENAFDRNKAFVKAIARRHIRAGKLRPDGRAILEMKELRPYFEARTAIARA